MFKVVSIQSLKLCFMHYIIAFLLGRLVSRIFGKGLQLLNFGPSDGASQTSVMMYFYASAFMGLVVMALGTVWIFLHLKKLKFNIPLFVLIAAIFSIVGVGGVAGMMNGLYPPQAVLAVIPVQFLAGLIFVARYTERSELESKQDKA